MIAITQFPPNKKEEFEPFHMRLFERIFDFPIEPLTDGAMNTWKAQLFALHAFVEHSIANDIYRSRYRIIQKQFTEIQDLSISDPERYRIELYDILSKWVAVFSLLYKDVGLTVRSVNTKPSTTGPKYNEILDGRQ